MSFIVLIGAIVTLAVISMTWMELDDKHSLHAQ